MSHAHALAPLAETGGPPGRLSAALFALLAALVLPACESAAPPSGRSCTSSSDCPGGRPCIDGRCAAPFDAGAGGLDGGTGTEDGGGVLPGEDAGPGADAGPVDAGLIDPGSPDEDMDGISDIHEGRATGADSDSDGIPDYRDIDSDGDGIFDDAEAGDSMVATPPSDSDGDGIADFRDLDSDGNGVLDRTEGGGDVDSDGRPNFRDLDNDGDGLLDREEVGLDAMAPADADGDGTPDMNERDSDADTISDTEEDIFDTDGDARLDRADTDSDGDGWTDAQEAGDADLMTPAFDSDGDLTADYRDPDSDNDGLSDAAERTSGTSRTSADTDGDGVSDLVEIGAGTRATDPTDSPRTRGDFVFLVPYMMPPSPTRDTLQFATDIQVADVYFLVDTTGSMGSTITNVRTSLSTAGSGIIDSVRARIPDTWFGVGDFRDAGDAWLYRNVTDMTMSAATAQAGVNALAAGGGGDTPEADVPALYATASGAAVPGYVAARTGCPAGRFGYPCFRSTAIPIVVLITDAVFHNGPTGSNPASYTNYATMRAAVTAARIRVIGVSVGASAVADLTAIARDSGAVDGAGTPLVSTTTSGAVSSVIVSQIQTLARSTRLDVSASAVDLMDAGESVNAVAAFVDHLETRGSAAPGLTCTTGLTTLDRPGIDSDSFPDTFVGVTAGTPVCFDILPRTNTTVMPTLVPQIFRAQINVIGDGFTPLDDRVVYFLVPPRIPDPGS